jgi:hypothetical protein
MAFKKGQSGNPKGRPVGSKTRTTEEIRLALHEFINGKIELKQLDDLWNRLSPKEKAQFFDRLLRHVLPAPVHELEKLSDEDLDRIITKLKNERLRIV